MENLLFFETNKTCQDVCLQTVKIMIQKFILTSQPWFQYSFLVLLSTRQVCKRRLENKNAEVKCSPKL